MCLNTIYFILILNLDGKRRQVTFEQASALLDFLKEHQELARGHTRGRRGKFHTLKIWNLCAKKLNATKDGAVKDGKGWSKYWCDWKYRVRRRALELKAARDNNRPAPDGTVPLSPMEEMILTIIGENAIDSVVIKSDPLADGDFEEEEEQDHPVNSDDTPVNQCYSTRSGRGRKRQHSFKEINTVDMDDHGGRSSPLERQPGVSDVQNDVVDDSDEDVLQFLQVEKEKLKHMKTTQNTLQTIATELTRLADVMGQIRDILNNNRINV